MLQDIQAGRTTEIDYINGYIVAQGKRLGLSHSHNATLIWLVKEQQILRNEDVAAPFSIGEYS